MNLDIAFLAYQNNKNDCKHLAAMLPISFFDNKNLKALFIAGLSQTDTNSIMLFM